MLHETAHLDFVSEIYDLKTAYDEKNGAPTAATPKKYFFVNTVTGEKSGEMLAVVSLLSPPWLSLMIGAGFVYERYFV